MTISLILNKIAKDRNSGSAFCSIVGISVNFLLFLAKLFVGAVSGSIAVISDAFNNLSDSGSSVIHLIGTRLSSKKADREHPFGHGRIEYLTGLAISVLILFMGVELAKESLGQIFHPTPDGSNNGRYLFSTIILAVSVVTKICLWYLNYKVSILIDSASLRATATDSLTDAVATGVILITTTIQYFTGFQRLDGIAGLAVSIFILYAGFQAARETAEPLLGKAPSPKLISDIEAIVLSHEEILGVHDLIVHDYGPGKMLISLHAEVSSELDISEIHDEIDNIETELKCHLLCDATIHCDPIETKNELTLSLRNDLVSILNQISEEISIHDFRVVIGKSHTNLLFDLVIPYQFPMTEESLCEKVRFEVLKMHPKHFCIIQIDQSYINSK